MAQTHTHTQPTTLPKKPCEKDSANELQGR